MRKLGKGQSVVFCVPQEIQTKIRALGTGQSDIEVSDILAWAISETYSDTRRSMPLWATQGERFYRQSQLWAETGSREVVDLSRKQAEKFLEDEAQSLDQKYRPASAYKTATSRPPEQDENLKLIAERCSQFTDLHHAAASLREEQERELAPEIEQERQIQRPPACAPNRHHLHDHVKTFASTGVLIAGSTAYRPAFEALRDTSAADHIDVSQFGSELLVTADFACTVEASSAKPSNGPGGLDAFQRSVQWIITGKAEDGDIKHMMIISPYEAEELLPLMKTVKKTALHLYAPRSSLELRPLDGLDLYTVSDGPATKPPRRLVVQLNLFAGQLYLSSYAEYLELCKYLGLAWEDSNEGQNVAADGFIVRRDKSGDDGCDGELGRCGFKESPVKFLKVLMTKIRRNCESIEKTHMGAILDGRVIRPTDFFKSGTASSWREVN